MAEMEKRAPADWHALNDFFVEKTRVSPQREHARGPRCPHLFEDFPCETGCSPAGVRIAAAHSQPENVPAARGGGEQGVEAPHLGVTEHSPLFFEAIGLAYRRVDVDSERALARPGPRCPRPFQKLPGHFVQAAGISPRKAAQERPEGRGRWHPTSQQGLGAPRPQHVGIVDRVPSHEGGGDQGQGLLPHVGMPRGVAQAHVRVHQLRQAEPLGQRYRQY